MRLAVLTAAAAALASLAAAGSASAQVGFGVYVGPSDLSLSMGKPPTLDPSDKEVLTAIDIIVKTTRKWGHIAGVHTDGPATALKRFEAGFQMCTILNDARLLAVAAANAINEVRGKAPAAKAKTY